MNPHVIIYAVLLLGLARSVVVEVRLRRLEKRIGQGVDE